MNKPIDLTPLDRMGWLADQPSALQKWVARTGRWRAFEAGDVIYDAGDAATGLYGLAEGSLEVAFPLSGHEPVSIFRAEPGFWIGDLALLAGHVSLVSVRTRHRARVLEVPGAAVRAHLTDRASDWPCFYALSYRNAANTLALLGEALALSPSARLARRLLQLATEEGTVRATQEELAGLTGVTRGTVRRALDRLIAEGAIATGYGHLHIRDHALITKRARGDD